jgi:hypothetical protein
MKIAILTNAPSPYRTPVFERVRARFHDGSRTSVLVVVDDDRFDPQPGGELQALEAVEQPRQTEWPELGGDADGEIRIHRGFQNAPRRESTAPTVRNMIERS